MEHGETGTSTTTWYCKQVCNKQNKNEKKDTKMTKKD